MKSQVDLSRCCLHCHAEGEPCLTAERADEKARENADVSLVEQLLLGEGHSKFAEDIGKRGTALQNIVSSSERQE